MSVRRTLATARRVLRQLRHDPRTIGLLLAVPCVLQVLVHELFTDRPQVFQSLGVPLLGYFNIFSAIAWVFALWLTNNGRYRLAIDMLTLEVIGLPSGDHRGMK